MKTKIAFMFLGGLPNPSEDSGKCWKIFLKNAPISYFKKIHFNLFKIDDLKKMLRLSIEEFHGNHLY